MTAIIEPIKDVRKLWLLSDHHMAYLFSAHSSRVQDAVTFEEEKNRFFSICRSGNIFEFMESVPFLSYVRHLVREYDHHGRLCTHIVARFDLNNAVMKIELLLNMGADVSARESLTGDSLLHIAVSSKNYELAEWLCRDLKANLIAINYAHMTPYHLAYFFVIKE
ncbi:hypothetical protein KQX54_010476 [Cotesia glomerata]|uniref:NF-kappa-B inhibitor alpha n=1 Tax=Cotesia glomerata TaxID=32391 RepID=A0AAV7ILE9_COTGL|nr:hypothetical protein KQX54_010476 [Cotesia glomerata]